MSQSEEELQWERNHIQRVEEIVKTANAVGNLEVAVEAAQELGYTKNRIKFLEKLEARNKVRQEHNRDCRGKDCMGQ